VVVAGLFIFAGVVVLFCLAFGVTSNLRRGRRRIDENYDAEALAQQIEADSKSRPTFIAGGRRSSSLPGQRDGTS